MPLSAEQQRERRAVKRAAEEAAGVFRRRRGGRLAAGHVWDEQTGTAVPQAPQPPASPSAEEGEANKMTPMEANKMTPMERKAKRTADQKRRRAAAQFSMASKDTEKVSEDPEKVIASLLDELVAEVAEVCDEVDECELQEELEKLVIARSGSPLLEDTGTREAAELELRADGYGAARGGDDGPQVYSLPLNELRRRVADGEDAWPGEAQMAWDQRVMRDRLARGVPLGDYLEELQQLLSDSPCDLIATHELANYGSKPTDWRRQLHCRHRHPPMTRAAAQLAATSYLFGIAMLDVNASILTGRRCSCTRPMIARRRAHRAGRNHWLT